MPFYEFRCLDCGHQFTRRTSWADKASTRCPECGSDRLREVFGLNLLSTSTGGSGAGGPGAAGCGAGGCGAGFG